MDETQVRNELAALLDDSGAAWMEERGFFRFRLRRDGMLWEAECRPSPGQALVYGRYPFTVSDQGAALRLCSKINAKVVRGAMFLAPGGRMVFRTRAELDDSYGARGRLAAALEYNAEVIAHFWGEAARAGAPV